MIRTDVAYVDQSGRLTQAGWSEFRGQETKIAALEAADATEAANAPGSAPRYACRAWVNFNGTGTVAIRSAGNVSSITDLGVGNYRANFATAMPDANFCAVASCRDNVGVSAGVAMTDAYAVGSVSVFTRNPVTGAGFDPDFVNIAVFR